jgi:hypothetical protein
MRLSVRVLILWIKILKGFSFASSIFAHKFAKIFHNVMERSDGEAKAEALN